MAVQRVVLTRAGEKMWHPGPQGLAAEGPPIPAYSVFPGGGGPSQEVISFQTRGLGLCQHSG